MAYVWAPKCGLALLRSLRCCWRSRLTRYIAHASVFISCRNFSQVRYRDIEGHDETPGRFETPRPAANLCACAVRESIWARRRQHGGRQFAKPTRRYQCRHDMSISQMRGGVQWTRVDQNEHILRTGMGLLPCQLNFMI